MLYYICQSYKVWTWVFSNFFFIFTLLYFLFIYLFSILESSISVIMILWLYYHILVISDNKVTVMVTSHKITEKDIEGLCQDHKE